MSVATITPHPRLAVVASEARKEARAQKRGKNPLRRLVRGFTVVLAIIFATMGLGAGTAQAWPWTDMQEDITAFVTNFCGPENVPVPQGHSGIDNLFGLNLGESDKRATAMPDTAGLGKEPLNGLERIQKAYAGQSNVITPTYERYGFANLQWDSYGGGCFAPGYWFTPVANTLLNMFVMSPIMLAMATLKLAMGTWLYTVFTGVISPFVSIFTAIFKGWALWLAPIGIIWAFWRSGGNLRVVGKTGAWMLLILGVFIWMGNNTSTIVTKANNFVTEFASTAATQMNEINGVSTGTEGTAMESINQALWYGVPYQTWLEGQVGPETAAADRSRVTKGEVSWGAAILNSKYAGDDDTGRDIIADSTKWNNLSYSPNEGLADTAFDNMKTKPGAWTKNKMWEKVPYLFNVKAICGDTSNGTLFKSSSAEDDNKWFYGGSCDAAGAGTANMVPYFTGAEYNSRMATAFSGGFAATAVCLAVAAASIYLAVQKMLFYFLLLFGPVFLTVAMFGDEKRAAFAKRYGELMIGNLLKQGVGVLVVLFVANAMSMLLYPPADEQFAALREIPWMLKPTLALFFLIGLAMFLLPLKRIVTGAVKGDTKVVDKTAKMPVDAAKTTAKVGVAAGVGAAAIAAVVASGGTAAPVVGKLGGMAMSAGRMAGGRGGVGKVLTTAGRGANLASRLGGSIADGNNKKAALSNLAKSMFANDSGVQNDLKQIPGALDTDGKMTPKGEAILSNAVKKTGKQGEQSARADALQRSYMDKFYKGHLAETGKHHQMDPNSPENLQAAAVRKEQERLAVRAAAKDDSSRKQNTGADMPPTDNPNDHPNNHPNDNPSDRSNGNPDDRSNGNPDDSNVHPHSYGRGFVVDSEGQAHFADAARENVSGPGFAQDQNVKANVTVDGAQVAEQMGMSSREVAQNPGALLAGSMYDGGDVSQMDPRNPATAAMNNLKFAMAVNDQPGIDAATIQASEAISQHGVPSQVSGISAVSATPEGMATAIGAMPDISDDTPWQVRAEGATTMQSALSFIPSDSASYEPMQNYVQALSSPSVDAETVEGLRVVAIEAESPGVASEAPTVDLSAAIRESAAEVSAAPVSVVTEQGASFGEPAPQAEPAPAQHSAPSFAQTDGGYGGPINEASAQTAPPQARSEPFFGGGESAAQDLFGNDYYDAPQEAIDAMPIAPESIQHGHAPQEVVDQYRTEVENWRQDYDILPPARGGRHSSGGYSEGGSLFGGIAGSFGRSGGDGLAGPPDEVEEISGIPAENHDDNSQPFRRTKRRRLSGLYDYEEDDDDE